MPTTTRILPPQPLTSLEDYFALNGGVGLDRASAMTQAEVIDGVERSGLRGRGGAGFPTGLKWRTVVEMESDRPASVVVNGAEGEPGSFKDRTILRENPYQVIEGAAIAAYAIGASEIVVAVKAEFTTEIERLRAAIAEFESHGGVGVDIRIVEGPSSYLFGEESALLEVVDGRPPLPRVTPPYRRGVGVGSGDANASSSAELGGDLGLTGSAALVNNVETLAHVAYLFRVGVEEFRSVGTEATPGSAVCTVTGAVARHGVAEFAMGTPLWEVIDTVGGGPAPDRTLIAAISGTASAAITADRFTTPLCFDAFRDAESGLGASGFIVFDDHTDFAAVAHGVARFLAVESCGQCEPCKIDGAAIAERLDAIRRSDVSERGAPDAAEVDVEIDRLMSTVADGARCGLAGQHQTAVASLHALAAEATRSHLTGDLDSAEQVLVAPLVDIVDGVAVLDLAHLEKALDWSTDGHDSGTSPADRL